MIWQRMRLWLFYWWYPSFRGPFAPEWVGTDLVELAWRFAEDIGFTTGAGRERVAFPEDSPPKRGTER